MRTFARIASIAGLSSLLAAPLVAQSAGDYAAYVALLSTPNAGLPPLLTGSMTGARQNGAQLALRYGHVAVGGRSSLDDLAATGILPVGTASTISLTAGVERGSCDGCDAQNALLLSIGGDMPLAAWPVGEGKNADRLTMTLAGEFGFGKPQDERALAGTVSLPFALSLGSGGPGMRITPFLSPGFGFASYQYQPLSVGSVRGAGSDTETGTRFLLGGGIGLWNPTSSIAVNGGFQHVFIQDGKTTFGLSLTLGAPK